MIKRSEIVLNGRKSGLLTICMSVLLFAGCSQKTPEIDTIPVIDTSYSTDTNAVSNDSQIDQMGSMDQSTQYATEDERIGAVSSEIQVAYFATDSYKLSDSEMDKVTLNANILNGDLANDLLVKVEGNCDEWGTDEYNYALGLKRAKYVKDSLESMGVGQDRMSLISYGESKPKCNEHNTGCWQQNRRVDLKLFPQ
jgi:peptidoglycan-associated lipoprotein